MTTYHYGNSDLISSRSSQTRTTPVYRTTYDAQLNYNPTTQSYSTLRKYEPLTKPDTGAFRSSAIRSIDSISTRAKTYGLRKPAHSYSYSSTSSSSMPSTVPLSPRTVPSYLSTNRLSYQHLLSQIAQITDHVYLSSINAISLDRIRELGITMIVSLITEPAPLRASGVENVSVPIEDSEHADLKSYLDRILEKMHREEIRGGRILVHCIAGVSRSASLVLAYLMRFHAMRLRQAYGHVRARRPYIQPNVGFWRQLIDYERRMFGTASVRLNQNPLDGSVSPDVPPSALAAVIYGRGSAAQPAAKKYSSRLSSH